MVSYSRIAHQNLDICSPVPWGNYARLLSMDRFPVTPKILDIGCGKCGLLGKAVEQLAGTGVGVDLSDSLANDLTLLAKQFLNSGKLQVAFEPAESFLKSSFDLYDLIICVGSSHAVSGVEQALKNLRSHLNPGGKIIFGELVWKSKPAQEFLDFLECEEKDQFYPIQLTQLAKDSGFTVIESISCRDSDFEAYELSLKASIMNWCLENPEREEVLQFREKCEVWSGAREKWARDAFGFEVMFLELNR